MNDGFSRIKRTGADMLPRDEIELLEHRHASADYGPALL